MYWRLREFSEDSMVFPCESMAQAAIDGFIAYQEANGISRINYYCDIQDADDAERGSLEPEWTGPLILGAQHVMQLPPGQWVINGTLLPYSDYQDDIDWRAQ
jgi:hypothetical protein